MQVIRTQKRAATTQYFVHYKGWNSKWREWVNEDRLMRDDERNRQFMEETNAAFNAARKAAKAAKNSAAAGAEGEDGEEGKEGQGSGAGRKRKIDSSRETEERDAAERAGKLSLPLSLKLLVVQDWELVTNKRFLPRIPIRGLDVEVPGAHSGVGAGAGAGAGAGSGAGASAPSASSASVPVYSGPTVKSITAMLEDFQAYLRGEGGARGGDGAGAGAGAGAGSASQPPKKRARKEGEAGTNTPSGGASSVPAGASASGKRGRGGAGSAPVPHPAHEVRAAKDICDALRIYFDKSLPVLLLFRFERMLYDAWKREKWWALREGLIMADICPPILLLRLLVRFPSLASLHGSLDKKEGDVVGTIVGELIRFMARNVKNTAYFAPGATYIKATDEYCKAYDTALAKGTKLPRIGHEAATLDVGPAV